MPVNAANQGALSASVYNSTAPKRVSACISASVEAATAWYDGADVWILPMTSPTNWRLGLNAGVRYQNVQNIQANIQRSGETSKINAQKAAFAAEAQAYNSSTSSDEYDSVCNTLSAAKSPQETITSPSSDRPSVAIGAYKDCHHIASGLISEVYRSQAVALKVITETRNVEPHNPNREVKILRQISHSSIIKLIETSKDDYGRLILVFPYMPLTLDNVLVSNNIKVETVLSLFKDLLSALDHLHTVGIIHRDIKPSNILLASASGPARLADFGTAWHPTLSISDEPVSHKVLEVGTGCYRAPEALFGNRSYGTSLDIWATGVLFVECLRTPTKPLFESRDSSEDGNQLGLILSIFKTLGTPTKASWPEAVHFPTPPFEWYQEFPGQSWKDLLPDTPQPLRDIVCQMVCYESGERLTAKASSQLLTAYVESSNGR